MTEDKYALTAWGAPKNINEKDVTLPSGQLCRVRELQMEDVLELDLIDAVDTFTGQLIDDRADGKETSHESDAKSFLTFLRDKEKREKLLKIVDATIPRAVVAPVVLPALPKGRAKKEGFIYVDQIELNDKLAIFTEIFQGFGDVSKFREEQAEGVGTLAE